MVGFVLAKSHHDNVAHIEFGHVTIEPTALVIVRLVVGAGADNVGFNFALADGFTHGLNIFSHGLEVVEKSAFFSEALLSVWLGIKVREHPVHIEVGNQFFHLLCSPYTPNYTLFNRCVKG